MTPAVRVGRDDAVERRIHHRRLALGFDVELVQAGLDLRGHGVEGLAEPADLIVIAALDAAIEIARADFAQAFGKLIERTRDVGAQPPHDCRRRDGEDEADERSSCAESTTPARESAPAETRRR